MDDLWYWGGAGRAMVVERMGWAAALASGVGYPPPARGGVVRTVLSVDGKSTVEWE